MDLSDCKNSSDFWEGSEGRQSDEGNFFSFVFDVSFHWKMCYFESIFRIVLFSLKMYKAKEYWHIQFFETDILQREKKPFSDIVRRKQYVMGRIV